LVKEYEGVSELKKQVALKRITTFECQESSMKENSTVMKNLTRDLTAANGSDVIKISDVGLWMFLFALPP
jgi:hypothetical protein